MKIIRRVLNFIRKHKQFLITTHARADGDALGSEIALASFLAKMRKSARIINTGGIPKEYLFLPGISQVQEIKGQIKGKYDALIVLDSGGFDRLEKMGDFLPSDLPILNIDHHASNDYFGQINWVEPKTSSVGEMIYRLIKASHIPLDKKMALNLYVSLITDTGHFGFTATTSYSHLMASDLLNYGLNPRKVFHNIYENKSYNQMSLYCEALRRMKQEFGGKVVWTELTREMYHQYKANAGDSQEYLKALNSIEGIQIAILFRETKDPAEGIKVSIRSEPPINANHLARYFGGGGHNRAAGCTIHRPLNQTRRVVLRYVKHYIGKR